MNVDFINPFIESVYELYDTMLGCEAKRGELAICQGGGGNPRDVTALIGLSGPVRGLVALSFPIKTSLAMVQRLLGSDEPIVVVDEIVMDGVAELVNIVAGGAKARFSSSQTTPIDLSLPTVVKGSDYSVEYPSQSAWIEVPFESELGGFVLRVAFENIKKD